MVKHKRTLLAMSLNSAQHATRLRWFFILTPYFVAISAVIVRLYDWEIWVHDHLPARFSPYTSDAIRITPYAWIGLILVCAFGICLDLARKYELKGAKLTLFLVCITPFVFVAQIAISGAIATACMALISVFWKW